MYRCRKGCPISQKIPQLSANRATNKLSDVCPICWESKDIGQMANKLGMADAYPQMSVK